MADLLIIGWGNTLRGDDGFGWAAAERLREALPDAEVLTVHQLTPELMEAISRARRVVFIDAGTEGEAGVLTCSEVRASTSAEAFTHQASPAGLLAGSLALYGYVPEAVLYSVKGESFEFGEELSAGVGKALEELVRRLGG